MQYDRGTLKFEAEKKAREGDIFQKKGESRSKDMTGSKLTIKRAKISQEERGDRIHEISQELEMLRKQIMMKQQIIAKGPVIIYRLGGVGGFWGGSLDFGMRERGDHSVMLRRKGGV